MPALLLDRSLEPRLQQLIDQKTKPLGALGQLETLALQIGLIQQSTNPRLTNPHILVFAGDHGIAADGVSAYPAEVTYQMVINFIAGGAAINAFTRQSGLRLVVCDVGVRGTFEANTPEFVKFKVQPGTHNMRYQPAMSADDTEAAMDAGRLLVDGVRHRDCNIVGFGEMGIGNSSSAALLMHRLLKVPLNQCVGRGTGLTDDQLIHKLAVLTEVADTYAHLTDPMAILSAMGGFEIAAVVGGILCAAENGMVILIDGFIVTAALLVARALDPAVSDYCVFTHQSEEAGHRLMLDQLDAQPLLSLGLRLGEGTGCALAYPLVQAAVTMLTDMASFESAGVSTQLVTSYQ
ncbi:nicotinate-nucleotide--dimethylbenzimidazole phosphoribosyltransferase [Fibrella forsythiae]|uniref:Nicotinate-nucleotide--dimethylbenzimidazole phosphoribosyltransferase n=1 Tax=Fibrella forsythiae TaxID=2817061 RepID=A0ABS3JBN9_9BACT|nr:nicotinate-nucleotide--dimethylbenzimidazole phosphoribosyltransferase [Fibrella forsythiae]MBO0947410.1 nicotinate-nucleotide--dimethylbenzimidazole phosphoribosyltransferase [Fibrella forsythiae]